MVLLIHFAFFLTENEFGDYLLSQTRHFGPRDGFGHLEIAHNFAPKQAKVGEIHLVFSVFLVETM